MSICNSCKHDGGDPGNEMVYVYCIKLDEIRIRPNDCKVWEEEADDAD